MKRRKATYLTLMLAVALAACGLSPVETITGVTTTTNDTSVVSAEVAATPAATVTEALADNGAALDEAEAEAALAYEDAAVVVVQLSDAGSTVDGVGVNVDGSTITIMAAGTYRLVGSLSDGQVIVNTEAEGEVRLILDGVTLTSLTSAPIYIEKAETVAIVLADGSTNSLTDAASYVYASAEVDEPNAAIFSNADLVIGGNGALTVTGNYADGIASDDGLVIAGGTLNVTAADDGLRGSDYVLIQAGSVTVNAATNAVRASNDEDAALGYVAIEGGTLNLTSGGDGIQAETDVLIAGGDLTITTGGGNTTSAKAIKGTVSVVIDGGTFSLNAADDAVHSNGSIVINGGTFSIVSGDDGLHADATLEINGGVIDVTQAYEGLESAVITLNAGVVHVNTSDDGVNTSGGQDGSGMGGPGGQTDAFSASNGQYLYINGGTLVVTANGDGVDVNGAVVMTGGLVIVNGPTANNNGALDYDAGFTISGGTVIATGSAGMAQTPDAPSSQASSMVNLTSTQAAGTLVALVDSAGNAVLTFAPSKPFQSIAFSSAALKAGETYTLYLGGSATGTVTDGLYSDATYSGGTAYTTLTLNSVVTQVGASTGPGRRP